MYVGGLGGGSQLTGEDTGTRDYVKYLPEPHTEAETTRGLWRIRKPLLT